jgi:hypothetical protein
MSLRVRLSLPFPLLTENGYRPGETDPESSIPRLCIRRNKAFFPAFAIRDICAVLDPHTGGIVNAKKKGSGPNALDLRGEDIGGIGVHIGARVSALAGPNDVLVSSTPTRTFRQGPRQAFAEKLGPSDRVVEIDPNFFRVGGINHHTECPAWLHQSFLARPQVRKQAVPDRCI